MTCVTVIGAADLQVRRIYCVGQNYRAHALEMGADPDRAPPFFFTKPADAILPTGATMPYPPMTQALEHEVELVVALGAGGHDIPPAQATALIHGYAVGLDMTRRDLQAQAKSAGRPWDMAKAFDHSAPCGPLTRIEETGPLTQGAIRLLVNGELRQHGNIADMIWSVAEVIAELSRYNTLAPGDLIYTGTPAGVGKLVPGNRLDAHIDGLHDLSITIGER
jgi:fumarylpyruvate hydrolase